LSRQSEASAGRSKKDVSTHNPPPDHQEDGRDAELSWLAAVAATLLVIVIAILAAAT
jgi:hypothetical protein